MITSVDNLEMNLEINQELIFDYKKNEYYLGWRNNNVYIRDNTNAKTVVEIPDKNDYEILDVPFVGGKTLRECADDIKLKFGTSFK